MYLYLKYNTRLMLHKKSIFIQFIYASIYKINFNDVKPFDVWMNIKCNKTVYSKQYIDMNLHLKCNKTMMLYRQFINTCISL